MSDFEKWWEDDNNFIEPIPFPRDHKELAIWCKTGYEAGRKAGVDEGRKTGLEEAAETILAYAQPNIPVQPSFSYAGIVTAVRERIK